MRIKKISHNKLQQMLARWERKEDLPYGLFYCRCDEASIAIYVAIDNTSNEFWMEQFPNLQLCKSWLRGKLDIDEYFAKIL